MVSKAGMNKFVSPVVTQIEILSDELCADEELMKANHGASIDIGKADYYK